MSLQRQTICAAVIVWAVSNVLLAQNEPPAGGYAALLRDPRNAPLTLVSDIRTLVGLNDGIKGAGLGLKGDVEGFEVAMRDLGAQVRKVPSPPIQAPIAAPARPLAAAPSRPPPQPPPQKVEIFVALPGDVLFDFDKVDIKPDAGETLKKLALIIRTKARGIVQIDGYTDAKGSDPYNQKLSEGRAASVKMWLTNAGIPGAGLNTRGFGKANPVAPNTRPDGSDNPEGRTRNRRVEVIIPSQ